MRIGRVIKSTGSWYSVQTEHEVLLCKMRGKFRHESFKNTNPIAVGDLVSYKKLPDDSIGLITEIKERKNYLIRKSTNLSRQVHVIAANIDLAFLVITIAYPETAVLFIDRFLLMAEIHKVPVALIFNKTDLYTDEHFETLTKLKQIYEPINYQCLEVSAVTGAGIEQIQQLMHNKTCIFAGNSGVGKSTLINTMEPDLNLRTAEISAYHKKGKHTTTFAEMFSLSNGGYIIDTPGIKSFGTVELTPQNIAHNFREMFALLHLCKYYNCTHSHEPNCAVIEAVINKQISESRYNSYLSILLDENNKYRTND